MKTLLHYLTTALIFTAVHSAMAADAFLKANAIGTVQTQITLGMADGRIHTTTLNNKRIFQEFQVSSQDYELVVSLSGGLALQLVPRNSSGGLPTITVVASNSISAVVDTKARTFKLQSPVGTGSATNLFQNLAGQIDGTIHYKGAFPPTTFSAIAFTVTATGTDTSGGSNPAALLKFKVTTQGPFVQH